MLQAAGTRDISTQHRQHRLGDPAPIYESTHENFTQDGTMLDWAELQMDVQRSALLHGQTLTMCVCAPSARKAVH